MLWLTESSWKASFCIKINIPGKTALRFWRLLPSSEYVESKNHSLVPEIQQTSFQHLGKYPQWDMNDRWKKYNKAINTINSFVQYSEGLQRTDPGVGESSFSEQSRVHAWQSAGKAERYIRWR